MQYPFALWGQRGKKVGSAVQKYGPLEARALPPGAHLTDVLLASLYDPSARTSMANTAEELARRYRISREEADEFGLRSHRNAKQARDAGHFDEEIEPVTVRRDGAAEPITVRHDTHVLEDASAAAMARLPPAFEPGGIVTAGNASAVVDGGAAMIIGREEDVRREGLRPLARVAGVGVAGCAPEIMGWGPVPATRRALARAGISGRDLDLVELNEAFAPQALACIRDFAEMGIEPERVNMMGNAIALGHPLGATGAILTLTAAYALRRTRKRWGLVTMCIGGGQGIAVVLESAS
jgi:acetyl-CoA acetyltransferase family protein